MYPNFILKNKKRGEEVIYPHIIFVILNLIFFSTLLIFVNLSSKGALLYEKFYAKQIALLIDMAEPETNISIDFKEGIKLSRKNGLSLDGDVIKINSNEVTVKLSNTGGYSVKFFSASDIDFRIEGDNLVLIIKNGSRV
ncbi:MAG: hypothetical protein QXU40_00365 [Candidatus Pacearchaeota archaeon]